MSKKNVGSSNSLLKDQIDKFFKTEKITTQELFYQISLLIVKIMCPDTDLYELFKNKKISTDSLDALINFFDGGYIKLPSKKEWKSCLLLTVVFYLKNIKGMSWDEIKKELPISEKDISNSLTISMGLKIKSFNDVIKNEFSEVINGLEDKEIMKSFHKLWKKP